jgi:hypothetical protein
MLKKDRGMSLRKLKGARGVRDSDAMLNLAIDVLEELQTRIVDVEDAVEKLQDEGISTDKVKEIANEIVDEFFN